MQAFIDREMRRKEHIEKWQINYYASNADIREAKRAVLAEAQAELERLEKEQRDIEDMRLRREENELRRYDLCCVCVDLKLHFL